MVMWSTEHLPRRDRFEYWREERTRRIFGAEAEIEPERRLDFIGRIAAHALGPATVLEIEVTPYTMRRTPRAIDRMPDGSFQIWKTVQGGGLIVHDDGEQRIGPGVIASGLADQPYVNRPDFARCDPKDLILCQAVRIPLEVLDIPVVEPSRLAARRYEGGSGIDALFSGYLAGVLEQAAHLTEAAAEQAVRTLAHLALAARGAYDLREDRGAAALRDGLLARAQGLIERDLHRADLSPARVAAKLGVSVRKLHLLFEPGGRSFSRVVLDRRLARADRMLKEPPYPTATEVAYACGFDSLSTFFRCYRAAYGDSPMERRRGG